MNLNEAVGRGILRSGCQWRVEKLEGRREAGAVDVAAVVWVEVFVETVQAVPGAVVRATQFGLLSHAVPFSDGAHIG